MGHSEQGHQPNTRPSLLSNSDEKNTTAVNILSGLEGLGKAKPSTQGSGKKISYISLLVILLAGVAASLMYFQNPSTPLQNKGSISKSNLSANPSLASGNAINIASSAISLPNDQQITASASTTPADGAGEKSAAMAATIITEASEKQVSKNEENPFSSMISNEKIATSASLPTNASATASGKKDDKNSSNIATKTVSAQVKPPSDKPAKNIGIASNDVKKESPPKSKNSTSAESDIALISALISRDTDNHKAKPDKHTQDIVERKPGDKTKNLLARCKNLGGLEADLCRSRICSGQWANESACLAPDNTSSRANSNGSTTTGELSKENSSATNAVEVVNKKI
ncbi:hypothetical protein [Undibacterium sp. Ren11W]|uniref:hypothetical protein n=1 Tax=Undibacterium sp. Ren11W TaxID=3413045 RepID=UPI003BF09841